MGSWVVASSGLIGRNTIKAGQRGLYRVGYRRLPVCRGGQRTSTFAMPGRPTSSPPGCSSPRWKLSRRHGLARACSRQP